MARHRILCGLLLASALLACGAGWLWMASGPRATRARFEQVKEGMTREEVTRIVGVPGDYSSGECATLFRRYGQEAHESWVCDHGELLVLFDDRHRATDVVLREILDLSKGPRPLTLMERIRQWLGL
jgi:hypothetical protein